MKDQHGNKITEHDFTKDIGHRTEEKTPKQQLEDIIGFSLTGNEFTTQNNLRIKMGIDSILSEERNKVLDEVKTEVEKELEKWDESAAELEDGWGNYTVCLPWELKEKKVDISTIIENLKNN